ncbi:hypothetical protein ACFE04_000182 [Oxalis oulophora]
MGTPITIIDSKFHLPNPIDLISTTIENGFLVTDVNNSIVFKVEEKLSFHNKRTLFDSAGNPLVTVEEKMTMHDRHLVYKGAHTSDLVFVVCQSSNSTTEYDVFLANNKKQNRPDFVAKGLTVYKADSNNIIAKVTHQTQNKRKFRVTISPNIDYAFIITLLTIVNGINIPKEVVESNEVEEELLLQVVEELELVEGLEEVILVHEEGQEEGQQEEVLVEEVLLVHEEGQEEEQQEEVLVQEDANEEQQEEVLVQEDANEEQMEVEDVGEEHGNLFTMIAELLGNL